MLGRHCRDLAVICGSASKAYAMTGWRCGWAIGPAAVIAAQNAHPEPCDLERSLDHAESGRRGADRTAGSRCGEMLDEYRERRDSLHEWLTADPRIRCRKPAGAFYMFVDISELLSLDGLRTSDEFAQALLDEARVAVTPGEAFDAPGFMRISYATSMDNLREGSRRLLEFVARARAGAPTGCSREVRTRRPASPRPTTGRRCPRSSPSSAPRTIGSKFGNRAVRAYRAAGLHRHPDQPAREPRSKG